MAETIDIPVTYKNKELDFKAHVMQVGYVQHIVVDLYGTPITIERDEENNFRALADPEKLFESKIDVELVKALVEVLESI